MLQALVWVVWELLSLPVGDGIRQCSGRKNFVFSKIQFFLIFTGRYRAYCAAFLHFLITTRRYRAFVLPTAA